MKIYLSTPSEEADAAARHGPVSLMAYRVGRGFRLFRTVLPEARAALMDVDGLGFTGYGPHAALISEMLRECRYRGYEGIVLDLPRPTPPLAAFAAALADAAHAEGLHLYLPEGYARTTETAKILLPAQNLTGTYEGRLRRLTALYGGRAALELERVHTDFALPAPNGLGSLLSAKSFAALPRGGQFWSPELAANYMSYISKGRAHLVLWDDADSLGEKLRLAEAAGIQEAFLYYPHVADIVGGPAAAGEPAAAPPGGGLLSLFSGKSQKKE